ncbi:FAD/FMN-containing dehydrogenase [Enhydrobacter aerosaccus]|uniref:FAD/FMN-containing dehydrogenase n=1 Tax=Enhydrobacter aerosaccus TaxID=225324 RepID=A0A1T4PGZ2_9HYPH|nr:FAD-binding oxidoreductase [Enhydrobacter aerosaccus]SJZ90782.1 FAD/FMN-containing dehydrogenase [Enhydrobacter aerosaccus]
MMRRDLIKLAGGLPLLTGVANAQPGSQPFQRVRPGDSGWPSEARWQVLNERVGGRLSAVRSPLDACKGGDRAACDALFASFKNPYFIRDNVALTQTTGWADAWVSQPSTYAVAARNAGDVAAAVDFARENRLRLVVRGGGHSYLGASSAPDSLLIWTRPMDSLAIHDAFVAQGCSDAPQPAVSLGAGNVWLRAYAAVTKTGRYVQGGGCCTVNVAGLVQGGGFGSFSKQFGLAGASLLEAEIVTADGQVRIANACTHPDLFWALKGGGGGSFGVITRVTLKTHDLPNFLGGAFGAIQAHSDDAYRRLIARFVAFYRERLFNPHWGETVRFNRNNLFEISMVFQGLDQTTAAATWKPFLDWVAASPTDYTIAAPFMALAAPAHFFWDVSFLKKNLPQVIIADDRPSAPDDAVFWASNLGEAGWYLHDYESIWLSQGLLAEDSQSRLTEALFQASRHWSLQLHFNKGLAGAPAEALAAARETPMNPDVVDAFALVIASASSAPAFAGVPGHEPDLARARREATAVAAVLTQMRTVAPNSGTYVAESGYFQKDWQRAYWGDNYGRLQTVKKKYDPDGLFFAHHGVGSEEWSADGFTRLT